LKKLVALFAILVALAILNPDMRDFRDHVEDTIGDRIAEETSSSALKQLGAGAVAFLAEQVSVRKNYLLFSTYTIDLDGPDREGNDWHFLGVGGIFVQLREPDDRSDSTSGTRS
jgi:hypothetical protein